LLLDTNLREIFIPHVGELGSLPMLQPLPWRRTELLKPHDSIHNMENSTSFNSTLRKA